MAYVASDAFASLVLHLTKTIVHSKYALVTTKGLLVGTFAGVAMIGGSYTGKLLLSRISKEKFLMVVERLDCGVWVANAVFRLDISLQQGH